MRVPMVFQWARAARQDPARRAVSIVYITSIISSQILWCLLVLVRDHLVVMAALALLPLAIELSAPLIAERRYGGPPWHPHHIAERYSLVIIIALGEGLVGTLATLAAVVGPSGPGWSLEVAVVGLAGTALTFGMWWVYFMIPSGPILAAHRERSFGWGYGHIVLFGATIAVGAGVHVAAFLIDRHSPLSLPAALLCTAIPVGLYIGSVFVLYSALTRSFDPFHIWMLLGSAIVIAAPIVMACAGVALPWCLAVLALAPWVSVVGYELVGHQHNARILDELPE
jgi:low temperature requirement protein LtrA